MKAKPPKRASKKKDEQGQFDRFNRTLNTRKRVTYWIGFLEGVLASGRLEEDKEEALMLEASRFANFFNDPDAADLAEDLKSLWVDGEDDLIAKLRQIIEGKRAEVLATAEYNAVDEMNGFLGFCAGIICDGVVHESEARALVRRLAGSDNLLKSVATKELQRALKRVFADRVLSKEEGLEIQEIVARLVGDGYADTGIEAIGTVANLDAPITDPALVELENKVFVLTGPMKRVRRKIEDDICDCGGDPESRVTGRTDFVVVSDKASRHWRTTHFGSKIQKAKEMIEEGCNIRFVTEGALEGAMAAYLAEDA
jgi:NAD-dependent DNA ligase